MISHRDCLAVNANAHGVSFHVAFSNDQHGVHFHLLGALDFAVDVLGALVDLAADFVCVKFVENRCVNNEATLVYRRYVECCSLAWLIEFHWRNTESGAKTKHSWHR